MIGEALFFDGRSAARRPARLALEGRRLRIDDPVGVLLASWPLADMRDEGDGRFARAGADARLLVEEPEAARRLAAAIDAECAPRRRAAGVRNAVWVASGLAGLLALVFVALQLLPAAARLIPIAWEVPLGDAIRAELPQFGPRLFGGSGRICEAPAGRAALQALVERLAVAADAADLPLQVSVIDLRGPNAFTLPGGRIVVFSGLLGFVDGPDELAGVLAHEMAHVVHRHVAQGLLRSKAVGVLGSMLLPDATGLGLGAGLGETLLSLSYSRAAEAEADALALAMLAGAGLRADGLARFFTRLDGGAAAHGPVYLSTHPPTAHRLAAVRAGTTLGEPALPAAEWQALLAICGP